MAKHGYIMFNCNFVVINHTIHYWFLLRDPVLFSSYWSLYNVCDEIYFLVSVLVSIHGLVLLWLLDKSTGKSISE